jgi:5-methylcytosine-specific restriction endonuclease McrA
MSRVNEFLRPTQDRALSRQRYRCASCGTHISQLGDAGSAKHKYGEGAQAHHMLHVKVGGLGTVENCVILCWSCHYSAHEGGNYRHGKVTGQESDYPYYRG